MLIVNNALPKEAKFMEKIKKFLEAEEGVTAIEYALIAAGMALAIVVIVVTVGGQLNTFFESRK